MAIFIKNERQIEYMRESCKIVAKTHELLEKHLKPGITTGELDKIADQFIRSQGAVPSFLGYNDFPANICISINEEVIHGIPGIRRLKDGDIVGIDIGAFKNGFHGDAARTHSIGIPCTKDKQLIDVTRQSFFEGIQFAKEGNHLNDVCGAIGDYIEANGFSVVREYIGHGVGKALHEGPEIPNYRMSVRGPRLKAGMTLAIEPMVNTGTYKIKVLSDDWTVVTQDGANSAHYENTILITDGEPEILTMS